MTIVFLDEDENINELSRHNDVNFAFGSPDVRTTVSNVSNGEKVIQVPFAEIVAAFNSAKSWLDLEAELKSWF